MNFLFFCIFFQVLYYLFKTTLSFRFCVFLTFLFFPPSVFLIASNFVGFECRFLCCFRWEQIQISDANECRFSPPDWVAKRHDKTHTNSLFALSSFKTKKTQLSKETSFREEKKYICSYIFKQVSRLRNNSYTNMQV